MSIFVSIASYRDSQCRTTLKYIFSNAEFPQKIYVGICQQINLYNPDAVFDKQCTLMDNSIYRKNIKTITLNHTEARGPTYARYLCSTLYNGEDYFFQIDAHTKLVKNWDTKLINMINTLKKRGIPKPLLSHYPDVYEPKNEDFNTFTKSRGVTRICNSFFNERGMISFNGAKVMQTTDYVETPYVAGGFIFSEGSLLKDVPFDKSLDYLFTGEEILQSVRIYTSGYNIFTPNENIAFHEYTRQDDPKIWTDKTYSDDKAFNKVLSILDGSFNADYLGTVRTLKDYYNFAGINYRNKTVTKDFCQE